MERIRAHILVRGRVQGVFFRVNMKRIADMNNVTGWVRNVPDGVTVEAVLEGTRDNVEKVICWSMRGPPGAEVRELKVEFSEYVGEFHSFRIIY